MSGSSAIGMFQNRSLDESFVADQYAIAAQAQASVDLPFYFSGCAGGKNDQVGRSKQNRSPYGPYQQGARFDYTTLGDELDAGKALSKFDAVQYNDDNGGNGGTWSGYQAVRHIFYGKDWSHTSSRRTGSSSKTCGTENSPTLPGSRRSAPSPIILSAAAATDRS